MSTYITFRLKAPNRYQIKAHTAQLNNTGTGKQLLLLTSHRAAGFALQQLKLTDDENFCCCFDNVDSGLWVLSGLGWAIGL